MKTEEIVGLIKRQLEGYAASVKIDEVGYVMQIGDGIAKIYGLDKAMVGELVSFPNDIFGMVLNLDRETVGVAVLGSDAKIKEGDEVKRTGRVLEVPAGQALVGRVVNPLGQPLDGGPVPQTSTFRPIEVIAPGVIERQGVKQPLQTGLKAIDGMIPIGRGQR